ncbi:ATP-binding protein [Oxalicibacterium faecigallinarum]|uniref:Virulence sensor protein BvgS n=1 Tax=Oxalicibacterium faecigallinarum TaxID=573741 RepID=A0A8J3F2Z4_9BURK|nr:ATP-binding protein [Oxalicibacterium faecigallinarum]GGI18469.1 sensor histidine kinase [Oxalicibacterium faecigallinarum]
MTLRIISVGIEHEQDVVCARQRARQVCELLGFSSQDQTRIATAVSELARNAYEYAHGGKVHFTLEGQYQPQVLTIYINDSGNGIADLPTILAGKYRSPTGMGVGITGARRLLDQFDIDSRPGEGTRITLKKILPADAPLVTAETMGKLAEKLAASDQNITLREVQLQNAELLATLAELKSRQDELLQLTQELESTNRGVVALYAELDEKADHLRRADEMKSRYLSNMSHEFRTPLSSIRALSKLLLDGVDGELTQEQETQVKFILKGADDLSELVNDLLDLAKIEAGKTEIRPTAFQVSELFDALRGMLKPLLVSDRVKLLFEAVPSLPRLITDESKLSQILRNFISNALKFTEMGNVTVSAVASADGSVIAFSVQDTGIGIAPADQQLIFEEFSQVQSHLQHRAKGTGLGLPLCKKLASLLGGSISIQSQVGQGSTFTVTIPVQYQDKQETQDSVTPVMPVLQENLRQILIVEDDPSTRLIYEKFLRNTPYQAVIVSSIREAAAVYREVAPAAILLDVLLKGETTWSWLAEIKGDPASNALPIIMASEIDDHRKAALLGADAYFVKPLFREELLSTLNRLIFDNSVPAVQSDRLKNFAVRESAIQNLPQERV